MEVARRRSHQPMLLERNSYSDISLVQVYIRGLPPQSDLFFCANIVLRSTGLLMFGYFQCPVKGIEKSEQSHNGGAILEIDDCIHDFHP